MARIVRRKSDLGQGAVKQQLNNIYRDNLAPPGKETLIGCDVMKNGFITFLSAAIVAAMVLLTGCIEVTDEEGEGPVEFWNSAYDYEAVVNTTDGEQGIVKTFSYTEVIIEAGISTTYEIGGTNFGRESTEIRGMDYNYTTGNETVVVAGTMDCFVIQYNLTSDAEGFPAWYTIKIWLEADDTFDNTMGAVYGYWVKMEAWGADGSYYLYENPNMIDPTSDYSIYIEGELNEDVEEDVIYHLFYSLWGIFMVDWDEGFRDGREWSVAVFDVGFSYSVDKIEYTVGAHTFDAWEAKTKWNSPDDSFTRKAVISTTCPIPLLFQWKVDVDGEINSYVYELNSITFA